VEQPYLASSIPESQLAEFHRLMTEEIEDVAVFFMDEHGIITTWNRAAEVMKGYTAEEAIGQHLELLYTE
jgi:PAS domain S-box-containing protein